jgi:hypothetical protein
MILPDPEHFKFKDCVIGGDECILIHPNNITCNWTEDNLHFRSIVIRKHDGKVVSRGFNRFHNIGEQPDLDPFPDGPFTAIEKRDGSLLIWGVHNGDLIHRTRATVNAESMPNGYEIEFLKKKYPKLVAACRLNPDYSILCEWESKTNIIVLREVDEPTLTLIGVIHNESGEIVSQDELDQRAIAWGLPRPVRYEYASLKECIEDVEGWVGREGVVIYANGVSPLRKIKGGWYRRVHSALNGFKTLNNVVDFFMMTPKFSKYSDFFKYVETHLDWEIANQSQDHIREITLAYSKVLDNLKKVEYHIDQIRTGFTRKEQARDITMHWNDWRVTAAFLILDNRPIDDKLIRKAILHEIENKN